MNIYLIICLIIMVAWFGDMTRSSYYSTETKWYNFIGFFAFAIITGFVSYLKV